MKNFFYIFKYFLIVFVLLIISCDLEDDDGNPFSNTSYNFSGGTSRLTFGKTHWNLANNGTYGTVKGTYTYEGTVATMRVTDQYQPKSGTWITYINTWHATLNGGLSLIFSPPNNPDADNPLAYRSLKYHDGSSTLTFIDLTNWKWDNHREYGNLKGTYTYDKDTKIAIMYVTSQDAKCNGNWVQVNLTWHAKVDGNSVTISYRAP